MKVFDKLILVSKESILSKLFQIDMEAFNRLPEKEKEKIEKLFPTENENDFMEVYNSTAPQLARLKRKMSVCLDVEVLEYDFNYIVFTYAGNKYKLLAPKNAYKISQALDDGVLSALSEMAKQGCIFINENLVGSITNDTSLQVDELEILKKVSDKFFFQTFLTS